MTELDRMIMEQIKAGEQQAIGLGIAHLIDRMKVVEGQVIATNGKVKLNRMVIIGILGVLAGLGIFDTGLITMLF